MKWNVVLKVKDYVRSWNDQTIDTKYKNVSVHIEIKDFECHMCLEGEKKIEETLGRISIFRKSLMPMQYVWMSYIINHQAKNKIATIAQGKSIVHVQAKELSKVMIMYPIDIEEQQKIADFLSDFDTSISLAKQELEKWKLLKKGFLQQMFV